ncbi:MAG: sigma-70 family RNA polymerase sigma factor [Phycisphaerales bacterium]|jgi:RNA polymerase sigma factor (sigma-70 family)
MTLMTHSPAVRFERLRSAGGPRAIGTSTRQAAPTDATSTPLDRGEFARLLEGARPALLLVAAAEVGRAGADDAVQQAAITALASLDRFEPGTDFRAWMATITRNAARNMRRSDQARGRRERRLRLVPSFRRDDARNALEDHRDLINALEQLSTAHRECLLLRIVGEHEYAEIGTILGIPPATARSHVYRARTQLLERLTEDTR